MSLSGHCDLGAGTNRYVFAAEEVEHQACDPRPEHGVAVHGGDSAQVQPLVAGSYHQGEQVIDIGAYVGIEDRWDRAAHRRASPAGAAPAVTWPVTTAS